MSQHVPGGGGAANRSAEQPVLKDHPATVAQLLLNCLHGCRDRKVIIRASENAGRVQSSEKDLVFQAARCLPSVTARVGSYWSRQSR
jgi:hypothetical protein